MLHLLERSYACYEFRPLVPDSKATDMKFIHFVCE